MADANSSKKGGLTRGKVILIHERLVAFDWATRRRFGRAIQFLAERFSRFFRWTGPAGGRFLHEIMRKASFLHQKQSGRISLDGIPFPSCKCK